MGADGGFVRGARDAGLTAAEIDRVISQLASRQHGVVARRQLRALGITDEAIAYRIANQRLLRLHWGVYAAGHCAIGAHGREMAAVLACGLGALLCNQSAGGRMAILPEWHGPVHVLAVGIRNHRGVISHRTRLLAPEDVGIYMGIPITSPARTLVDLAGVLPVRDLERAVHRVEALRLATREELEIRFSSDRRGIGKLRDILEGGGPAPTRSELERRFLTFLDAHGLPEPRVNQIVEGFEVDFHWPEAHLIVELDGFAFHSTRDAFERDRARDAALQAAGWRVVRVTQRRLISAPAPLADELHRLVRPARAA